MSKIRDEIKDEMSLCDREIRKAREEIIRWQERSNLYGDRKTMLFGLLQIIESDEKEVEKQDESHSKPHITPEIEGNGKSYLIIDSVARCPRKEELNEQN
ncbi:MAG: hypothetical protein J6A19_04960 [Oscillospiraceae bacterium]|nr:hypothetical protein [Oscillospiraceae bacterium]